MIKVTKKHVRFFWFYYLIILIRTITITPVFFIFLFIFCLIEIIKILSDGTQETKLMNRLYHEFTEGWYFLFNPNKYKNFIKKKLSEVIK